jgi:hypothetical protein
MTDNGTLRDHLGAILIKKALPRIIHFCELVIGAYIGIWIARNWL